MGFSSCKTYNITNMVIENIHKTYLSIATSSIILLVAFIWGFSEAIWFFVIPDVFLTIIALFSFRKALLGIGFATLWAIIGGGILFWFGWLQPDSAQSFLLTVPLVSEKMIQVAQWHIDTLWYYSLFFWPSQWIPYKVYAALFSNMQLNMWNFLLVSIPARAYRMLTSVCMTAAIGYFLNRYKNSYSKYLPGIHAIVWINIYIAYTILVLHTYF